MRRPVLAATALLLAGCSGSGFYEYIGDTTTLPGANPNIPHGDSNTYQRVRAIDTHEPPVILTTPGDVWPGPPPPQPTLMDLQRQQNENPDQSRPVEPLPEMPGFTLTPPPPPGAAPNKSFPRGTAPIPGGGQAPVGGNQSMQTAPGGSGNIVVPNGNGTSTVISPNGTVTTIPTPH